MLSLFRKATGGNNPPRLPAELVASIERMAVLRRTAGDVGAPRVAIKIPGVGSCYLGEDSNLHARIQRAYPDLSEACTRRAVALIEAEIARRNREDFRQRPERKSWVWGWQNEAS
jgi:hypothetical protein